jgi:uncharacterized alpha-E superfamily protein
MQDDVYDKFKSVAAQLARLDTELTKLSKAFSATGNLNMGEILSLHASTAEHCGNVISDAVHEHVHGEFQASMQAMGDTLNALIKKG